MPLFRRRRPSLPEPAKHQRPQIPGAYLFTLRSVPHHYFGLLEVLESADDANVYFSEELSYIGGRGVALFRVEATGFSWLPNLYEWWAEAEREEAFPFDINLFVYNKQRVGSLRGKTPEQVEAMIREHAPTFEPRAEATGRR